MSALWLYVQTKVLVILQVGLPGGFVLMDMALKWTSGKTVFRDFGADVCRAGLALYLGTIVGLIATGKLQAPTKILTSFIFVLVFVAFWWGCVILSYGKLPVGNRFEWQKWVAALIGMATAYGAAGLSWYLMADPR